MKRRHIVGCSTNLNERSCPCPDKCGDVWLLLNGNIHDGTILIDTLQDIVHGFRVLFLVTQRCFEILDIFGRFISRDTFMFLPIDPLQFVGSRLSLEEDIVCAFTDFRWRHRPETTPGTT